jgi:hypothetical protein
MSMGGEDFSQFGRVGIPTFYFWLGSVSPEAYAVSQREGGQPPAANALGPVLSDPRADDSYGHTRNVHGPLRQGGKMMKNLEAAYLGTSYDVDGPEGRIVIRVGEKAPLLDRILRRHHARTWAFVTAANPGSLMFPDDENHQRHADLEKLVRASGYLHFPGESVGDDGTWSAEASLLVIGISANDAATIGRTFSQNAIVIGEMGEPARLMWL